MPSSKVDKSEPREKILAEFRTMLGHGRETWGLIAQGARWALSGAIVVMAVGSACNTIVAVLLGRLVNGVQEGLQNHVSAHTLVTQAHWTLGWIAAVYVLREGLNVSRRWLVAFVCSHAQRDISLRLVEHQLKVPLAKFVGAMVGSLHGRISRSIIGLVHFLRLNFLDFLPAFLTGLFALATAISKQPLLGAVMMGVIPMSFYLTARQITSEKGVRLRMMQNDEEIDGAVVEQLGGIEYVRAANTIPREVERLSRMTEQRRRMELRHNVRMALFGSAKAINEGFFHVIVLAAAIYLAIHGRISTGDVFAFSVLFLNVMAPLSELHRVLDEGHESSLQVGELLAMLRENVDQSFTTQASHPPAVVRTQPIIIVENLRCQYNLPARGGVEALDDVTLTIRHGETIGIAGRSGGGKSTFLKVLLRLIHPSAGRILIGSVPLDGVSRDQIGQIFGYVGQSPFVFSGTIAENIAYGNPRATLAEIRRVAEMANLHDDILKMPGQYDAPISERGQNLSGGQRQRLAVARVLLKQPPILVLDEATSALDNISERHVQRSLGLLDADRTTILVAHRLTTLRDADRIFVFDQGRIVESGRYDELIDAGLVFAELVASAEHGVNGFVRGGATLRQPTGAHR